MFLLVWNLLIIVVCANVVVITAVFAMFVLCLFFFFKQKTAYEMLRSLVGSEMCIRDRH